MKTFLTGGSLERAVLDRIMSDDYLDQNHEYCLSKIENMLYRLKTVLCILFRLYNSNPSEDGITIIMVDFRSWYAGWDAEYCSVGIGFFKNWWYTFYSDGDSCV